MLHTALVTALPLTPALLPAQELYELAALTPTAPATGLWFLDFAAEAFLWTQLGVLTALPELPSAAGAAVF